MIIRERSQFRLIWNIIVGLAVLFVIEQVTFELAFTHNPSIRSSIWYYGLTLLFIADIWVRRQSSFSARGQEVTDLKAIRTRFDRKYLIYDLIAVLPFDLFFLGSDATLFGEPAVLLLRILAFLRLRRLMTAFKNLDNRNTIEPGYIRLVKFGAYMFIFIQLIACGWFLTSLYQDFPADGWVAQSGLVHASSADQYTRSLYWTITTMTTIGYGDIAPHTHAEYLFAMVVMLLGASMYAYIIGNIASLVNNLDALKTKHNTKLDSLSLFLRYRKVPVDLISKVKRFYDYLWDSKRGVSEQELLDDLPDPLKLELMHELTKDLISKIPIFQLSSNKLKDALLSKLRSVTYPPGSIVSYDQSISFKISFISSGEMAIIKHSQNMPYAALMAGEYFGLMPIVLGEKSTASIVTSTYCEVFELPIDDYEEIKVQFPEFNDIIKKVSSRQSRALIQRIMDKVII